MDPPVQVDFNGEYVSLSLSLSPVVLSPHSILSFFVNSGYTIHSTPVPSGGPLLLFLLNVMDEYGLSPSSDINLTYHRLVEAFKYGFALRTLTGDPNCEECGDVREEIMGTQINMTRYALELIFYPAAWTMNPPELL